MNGFLWILRLIIVFMAFISMMNASVSTLQFIVGLSVSSFTWLAILNARKENRRHV